MTRQSRFRSTPPRRRRRERYAVHFSKISVSIHASAQEATTGAIDGHPLADVSIHASAQEATRNPLGWRASIRFRSTPPRRRRPYALGETGVAPPTFRSTPPRGRRLGNQIERRAGSDERSGGKEWVSTIRGRWA